MLLANEVIAKGDWQGLPADCVVLDFDDRHRRRLKMTGVNGLEFLLDLAAPIALRSGDAVKLSDGRLVEIVGMGEKLLEIRAQNPEALARLAWHLGNRHLPIQVLGQSLRIRRDHVIEAMLAGMGAKLRAIEAPFDPEGGAYAPAQAHKAQSHNHDHDHHHGHHHHHDHAHDHD